MAETYMWFSDYYFPPREAIPRAREAAKKALEIDHTLAEAHATLASVYFWHDWDWAAAEREFPRAIALNPNSLTVHHQYGWYLAMMGRFDEGIAEMKRARELDPLSLLIATDSSVPFYLARRTDQAIEQCRKAIELDPNFSLAHYALGLYYVQKREFPQTIAELQKARQLEDKPYVVAGLGYAYGASGKREEAQKVLGELKEQSKRTFVAPGWIAQVYIGLGEKEQAIAWLEKAYEARSVLMVWLKTDPMFDPLRSDPRFQDLLRRVGHPPEDETRK